jgi:hypothetical protein
LPDVDSRIESAGKAFGMLSACLFRSTAVTRAAKRTVYERARSSRSSFTARVRAGCSRRRCCSGCAAFMRAVSVHGCVPCAGHHAYACTHASSTSPPSS